MTTATIDAPDAAGTHPRTNDNVLKFPTIRSIRVADDVEWSLVGEPLRDHALRYRVVSELHEVSALPGFDNVERLDDDRNFTSIQAALKSAYDRLAELIGGVNYAVIGPAGSRLVV